METCDERMLLLIENLKSIGIIRFDIEFCRAIDLKKQNLVNIKKGRNHFTTEHVYRVIREFNIDANWIFGLSNEKFLRRRTQTKNTKDHTFL